MALVIKTVLLREDVCEAIDRLISEGRMSDWDSAVEIALRFAISQMGGFPKP